VVEEEEEDYEVDGDEYVYRIRLLRACLVLTPV